MMAADGAEGLGVRPGIGLLVGFLASIGLIWSHRLGSATQQEPHGS